MTERMGKLEITAATNLGRHRPANEDAIIVGRWLGFGDDTSHSARHEAFADLLLAVADGLGGHEGGNVASRMVVEGLAARTDDLRMGDMDSMIAVVAAIDQDLRDTAMSEPSLRTMGSTLAMAVVSTNAITVLNIGDSRIYLSEGLDELRQISIDDVPVDLLGERTLQADGNAVVGRASHRITQALGGAALRRTRLQPHVQTIETSSPWTLLLCSDGLTDYVSEAALKARVMSPSSRAGDLVEMALAGGGGDNISAVLARYY
jgi:protein phosphatase